MSARYFNRRFFLQAGGALVALPLLPSLLPKAARAQAATAPRRAIFVFTPNGDEIAKRFVSKTETGFVLGEFLAAYEPYRADMLFVEGVDKYLYRLPDVERADEHQQGTSSLAPWRSGTGSFPLGDRPGSTIGYVKGPSLDKRLGDLLKARDNMRYGNLVYRVGDRYNNIWNQQAHAGPEGTQSPVAPETNPFTAYTRIFADVDPAARDAALKRLTMRQSALDTVKGELASLKPKLSADDKVRLELHEASIRDIETGLSSMVAQLPACNTLNLGATFDPLQQPKWLDAGRLFFRISAMAFACDLTRVINFAWAGGTSDRVYRELGVTEGHHSLSHNSGVDAFTKIRTINRSLHEGSANELYTALKAVPEDGGTVYDNTLIMHWSELAQGNTHSNSNNLVMFGGGGAKKYFRTGRYVTLAGRASNSFSDLQVHLFKYFGFNTVNSWGDPLLSKGALPPGLT